MLCVQLLEAGAEESLAVFTDLSVTTAEKNSNGGMHISNIEPRRLPRAVSALW